MSSASEKRQQSELATSVAELMRSNHESQNIMRDMASQIGGVVTAVSNLTDATKALKADLDGVKNKQSESGKVQWGVLIIAAGMLLGGGQYFTSQFTERATASLNTAVESINSRFEKIDDDMLRIYKEFREHAGAEGHPWSVIAKIDALGKQVELQRSTFETQLDHRLRDRKQDDRDHRDLTSRRFAEMHEDLDRLTERVQAIADLVNRRTGVLFKDGQAY